MKKKKQATASPQAHPMPPQPVRWNGKQIYSEHNLDQILKALGRAVEDRNSFTVEISTIAFRFLSRKPVVSSMSKKQHLVNVNEFIEMLQQIFSLKNKDEMIADLICYPTCLTREEATEAYDLLQTSAAALHDEAICLRRDIIGSKPEHGGRPTGTARYPIFKRMVREMMDLYKKHWPGPWIMSGKGSRRIYSFVLASVNPLRNISDDEFPELFDPQGKATPLNSLINSIRSSDRGIEFASKEQDSEYIKHLRRKHRTAK
jgi:hypothetical protein